MHMVDMSSQPVPTDRYRRDRVDMQSDRSMDSNYPAHIEDTRSYRSDSHIDRKDTPSMMSRREHHRIYPRHMPYNSPDPADLDSYPTHMEYRE